MTKRSLSFVGLVMFFNWVNLDSKLRVAILGDTFSISHPFVIEPTLLELGGQVFLLSFFFVTALYIQWHLLWSELQRWHLRIRCHLHWCRCWSSSSTWPYHLFNFRCCWIAVLSFQTPIRADLGWGLTHSRQSSGHTISWTGALPMQNLLHVHKSKNLCCAPSASLLLLLLHCSSLRYWNLETAPVRPGQDTIATLAQCLTNCQGNTRVLPCCTTSSPMSSKSSSEQMETEDFNSHQFCDACGGVSP